MLLQGPPDRGLGVTAHMADVFEYALTLPWVETIMFPYNIVETQGEALMKRAHEQASGMAVKPLMKRRFGCKE